MGSAGGELPTGHPTASGNPVWCVRTTCKTFHILHYFPLYSTTYGPRLQIILPVPRCTWYGRLLSFQSPSFASGSLRSSSSLASHHIYILSSYLQAYPPLLTFIGVGICRIDLVPVLSEPAYVIHSLVVLVVLVLPHCFESS